MKILLVYWKQFVHVILKMLLRNKVMKVRLEVL